MNGMIEEARQIALDALKPTANEFEHGVELHAGSVVCDTYGFAPISAPDGDALQAAIDAGASAREVEDLKEEMTMTGHLTDPSQREAFVEAWRAAGVTCIFQNAGEEGQSVPRMLKRLARFTYVTDMMPEFLTRAVRPDDVVRAKQEGKHCMYLTGNGVPLAQDWNSVEEELGYIRVFFQLGIRMMHLTYNRRNMIGDGCGEASDGGLSDFGRAVIAEMNRVGVIVDVAHSGWRTSLEAAQASDRPVVASHTGACAVNEHIRCKPDSVIKAIADTGGYVGICAVPGFLGKAGDVNALLDHVDYVAKTFGVDHVAIGTDAPHQPPNYEREIEKFKRRSSGRARWGALWPPGSLRSHTYPRASRLSLAWTNWPLFTVGLVQRGYCDEDIRKIIGGNFLRVARDVLPEGLSETPVDDGESRPERQ